MLTSNDIFRNSQVERVRELKNKVAVLTRERDEAVARAESLEAHFALALLAAQDAARLSEDGEIVIVDGWNAVFDNFRRAQETENGEERAARAKETVRRRDALVEDAKKYAQSREDVFVWLVFDGKQAGAVSGERWRVSYTGGSGTQRADRMICDFVRMIRLAGGKTKVTVMTNDRGFKKEAVAAGANVAEANALCKRKENKSNPNRD